MHLLVNEGLEVVYFFYVYSCIGEEVLRIVLFAQFNCL